MSITNANLMVALKAAVKQVKYLRKHNEKVWNAGTREP
jgi:hypothetical protein